MPDNPRWKRRPAGSTWGDWGPDDQLGRLNLLTPDKVLKGVAEVTETEDGQDHRQHGSAEVLGFRCDTSSDGTSAEAALGKGGGPGHK